MCAASHGRHCFLVSGLLDQRQDDRRADQAGNGADPKQHVRAERIQDDAAGRAGDHAADGDDHNVRGLAADSFSLVHDLIDVLDDRRQEERESDRMHCQRQHEEHRRMRRQHQDRAQHESDRCQFQKERCAETPCQPGEPDQRNDLQNGHDRVVGPQLCAPAAHVLEQLQHKEIDDLMIVKNQEDAACHHEEDPVALHEIAHADGLFLLRIADRFSCLCRIGVLIDSVQEEEACQQEHRDELPGDRQGYHRKTDDHHPQSRGNDRITQRSHRSAAAVVHCDAALEHRLIDGIEQRLHCRVNGKHDQIRAEQNQAAPMNQQQHALGKQNQHGHQRRDFKHIGFRRTVGEIRGDWLDHNRHQIADRDQEPDLRVGVSIGKKVDRTETGDDAVRHPVCCENFPVSCISLQIAHASSFICPCAKSR